MTLSRRTIVTALAALLLGGCATMPNYDPPQVTVASIEPAPSEGMEVRLVVKLRVQNPNDAPIDYDGVSVKLDVLNRTFATGVSDEKGSVPRFGESVIAVPVTISVLRMVKNFIGVMDGKPISSIHYEMSGKLNTGVFSAYRFQSRGEIAMPTSTPEPAPDTT